MSGGPKLPGQWVAIDVNFLASPLAIKLLDRFGPAGPLAWIGLLCACKRSPTPGVMTFSSEAEALAMLGLTGIPLVDNAGEKWDLETLWTVLGQLKQTKRTRRGHVVNVTPTHWKRWQDDAKREAELERKRRWWLQKQSQAASSGTSGQSQELDALQLQVQGTDTSPPTPASSAAGGNGLGPPSRPRGNSSKTNGKGNGTDRVVDWLRQCVPGTGLPAAQATVARLRAAGVADALIEEAAGYAAEQGGQSARYVETLALDWMAQRDPTWSPCPPTSDEPRSIADAFRDLQP